MKTWIYNILFFIILHLLTGSLAFSQDVGQKTFQDTKRQGVYVLFQGTDGCSPELVWTPMPTCQGFQLAASVDGHIRDPRKRELFCHINKGSGREVTRTDQDTQWNIWYRVNADKFMVRKHQQIKRNTKGILYEIELQASVILDSSGAFIFDRSLGGEGTSCLYKKADANKKIHRISKN